MRCSSVSGGPWKGIVCDNQIEGSLRRESKAKGKKRKFVKSESGWRSSGGRLPFGYSI